LEDKVEVMEELELEGHDCGGSRISIPLDHRQGPTQTPFGNPHNHDNNKDINHSQPDLNFILLGVIATSYTWCVDTRASTGVDNALPYAAAFERPSYQKSKAPKKLSHKPPSVTVRVMGE
jgi:hypothetical protein